MDAADCVENFVKMKLFVAASALALTSLSAPAAAQHSGHGAMPMPSKPAAKKTVAKKAPVKKRAARPAPVQAKPHSSHPPADAAMTPIEPQSAVVPTPMDHSAMEHDAMPMPVATPGTPVDHAQMDHGPAAAPDHGGHGAMAGALGPYPMARESSGTAWQPDASKHEGLMGSYGDWTLMGHGVLSLVVDHQSGRRGDDKIFVPGMVMGMARRPIGNGTLQFKAMVSPDPLMGKRGYPLLLASGETADGTTRLIDRQHPHDFFMELSGSISQNIGEKSSAFLYAGLPGEPAFGPPAFMHREAIMDSPEAPITHHWLDSTHISFGVLTAGLVLDKVKLELSRFNGREPDQRRWNIETAPLDSTAVRISWNPTRSLSLQASWADLTDPEQLEPGVDQKRWSASALYSREIADGWKLAATLAWGRKSAEGNDDDAFAAEGSLKRGAWTIFGRGEITENRELEDVGHHGPAYRVGKISLGALRDFRIADHLSLGAGGLFAVNFIPDALRPLYGGSNPTGAMGFVRLKLD